MPFTRRELRNVTGSQSVWGATAPGFDATPVMTQASVVRVLAVTQDFASDSFIIRASINGLEVDIPVLRTMLQDAGYHNRPSAATRGARRRVDVLAERIRSPRDLTPDEMREIASLPPTERDQLVALAARVAVEAVQQTAGRAAVEGPTEGSDTVNPRYLCCRYAANRDAIEIWSADNTRLLRTVDRDEWENDARREVILRTCVEYEVVRAEQRRAQRRWSEGAWTSAIGNLTHSGDGVALRSVSHPTTIRLAGANGENRTIQVDDNGMEPEDL